MEKRNATKAGLIYDVIDGKPTVFLQRYGLGEGAAFTHMKPDLHASERSTDR